MLITYLVNTSRNFFVWSQVKDISTYYTDNKMNRQILRRYALINAFHKVDVFAAYFFMWVSLKMSRAHKNNDNVGSINLLLNITIIKITIVKQEKF